jgi:hypothetical protein
VLRLFDLVIAQGTSAGVDARTTAGLETGDPFFGRYRIARSRRQDKVPAHVIGVTLCVTLVPWEFREFSGRV